MMNDIMALIETDHAKDHDLTESMYNDIGKLFESLKKKYKEIEKEIDDPDIIGKSVKLDYLLKFAGSMGYTAQVHAGLAKAYHQEKRLTEIEKRLEKIPPDVLAKHLNLKVNN